MQQMSIIRDGVKYNYWARDRQLRVCASLPRNNFFGLLEAAIHR